MVRLIRSGNLSGIELLNISLGQLHQRQSSARRDQLAFKQAELTSKESTLRHVEAMHRMEVENQRFLVQLEGTKLGLETEMKKATMGMAKEVMMLEAQSQAFASESFNQMHQAKNNITTAMLHPGDPETKVPEHFTIPHLEKMYQGVVSRAGKNAPISRIGVLTGFVDNYLSVYEQLRDGGTNETQAGNLASEFATRQTMVGLAKFIGTEKSKDLNYAISKIDDGTGSDADYETIARAFGVRFDKVVVDENLRVKGNQYDLPSIISNQLMSTVTGVEAHSKSYYEYRDNYNDANNRADMFRGQLHHIATNANLASKGLPLASKDDINNVFGTVASGEDLTENSKKLAESIINMRGSETAPTDMELEGENVISGNYDDLGGPLSSVPFPPDPRGTRINYVFDKKSNSWVGTKEKDTTPSMAQSMGMPIAGGGLGLIRPEKRNRKDILTLPEKRKEESVWSQDPGSIGGAPLPPTDTGQQEASAPTEEEIMRHLEEVNAEYGFEEGYLSRMAWIESGYNPSAVNDTSGASGMFQFVKSTAKAYDLDEPMDYKKSTEAAVSLSKENQMLLKRAGIDPNGFMLYMAHQQGYAGLSDVLSVAKGDTSSLKYRKNVINNLPQGMRPKEGQNVSDRELASNLMRYYESKWRQAGSERDVRLRRNRARRGN